MRGVKIFGRVLSGILTAVLALLLAVNVYTIAARYVTGEIQPAVFGWSWAVVVSGSMSPEIQVDDLVVIHEQERYAVGDIISFESGRSLVTHRIVEQEGEAYRTKGDFNNTVDRDPVAGENIVGKVVKIIPGMGRYLDFLRTPLGMTILVVIGFLMIEVPYLLKQKSKKGGRG